LEPRVILEVRSGDVVLIPSAYITHCNSGLNEKEERQSVVFYTAGGLYRWMWNGYKKENGVSDELKREIGEKRWKCGWGLFPTMEQLKQAAQKGEKFRGTSKEFIDLFTHEKE
jgi:hypothetical protein